MNKTILATADVARLFNVTETTVKRWANDGTLKCMKTPGGHRKFEMKDVVEFSQTLKYEPSGALSLSGEDQLARTIQVAILARDFGALRDAFIAKALSTDMRDLFVFFSYLYQHRIALWEMHDLIIAPGMREIGERWASGELTIGQEHLASYETLDALAKLQAQIHVEPLSGHSVVCASPGEEQHEIGLRCASYLFAEQGWRTHYLGARVPHDSIMNAAKSLHPSLVCLSVTNVTPRKTELDELVDLIARIRRLKIPVVVGGRAVCGEKRLSTSQGFTYCSSRELIDHIKKFYETQKK